MWSSIVNKIKQLKNLDKQCQAFGASSHKYRLLPRLKIADIEMQESLLNISLPDDLKSFYCKVGNGIAGPYYGLSAIQDLQGYHADKPYTEPAKLIKKGNNLDKEYLEYVGIEGYFEVDHKHLTGLLVLIHEGCGHEICMIANGEKTGQIVYVTANGWVYEKQESLSDIYHQWLDKELKLFNIIKSLILAGKTLSTIEKKLKEQMDNREIESITNTEIINIIAGIINAKRPVELFGSANSIIYDLKNQTAWLKKVLKEWQKENISKVK